MSRFGLEFIFINGLLDLAKRRGLPTLAAKVFRLWSREGLSGVLRALKSIAHDYRYVSYRNWFDDYGVLRDGDRIHIQSHIETFTHKPSVSILILASNAESDALRHTIDSVRAQIYPAWELYLAYNDSSGLKTAALLEDYHRQDDRIRITTISTGAALDVVAGDFVALLTPGDALAEHALYLAAAALEHDPELDMLYSDEDVVDSAGRHGAPTFKPDWNPDLLLSRNFVGRLAIFRSSLVRTVGGFRPSLGDALEWDLALRISEIISIARIHHLPYVIHHRRNSVDNASSLETGVVAVREHLVRTGQRGVVESTGLGLRVRFAIPEPPPLVSILIPTRNGLHLLQRCLDSVRKKTSYAHYEIIVVDNQSNDPATLTYLDKLASVGSVRVLEYDAPFNYAAINNFAARVARGDLLCLLNNDIEVIDAGWLDEMVSHAARPEIGAVGALLYYPDNTIQHAGVIIGMSGCADHPYAGQPRGTTGMMGRARLVQNLSAVTAACLVIRKEIYDAVGGFDAEHLPISFNDVDFCLRVIEHGYRNLWTPYAELYHHESASRGPEDTPAKVERACNEAAYMRVRWPQFIKNDPAFNPNLSLSDKWPRHGANPRVRVPWLPD